MRRRFVEPAPRNVKLSRGERWGEHWEDVVERLDEVGERWDEVDERLELEPG